MKECSRQDAEESAAQGLVKVSFVLTSWLNITKKLKMTTGCKEKSTEELLREVQNFHEKGKGEIKARSTKNGLYQGSGS